MNYYFIEYSKRGFASYRHHKDFIYLFFSDVNFLCIISLIPLPYDLGLIQEFLKLIHSSSFCAISELSYT